MKFATGGHGGAIQDEHWTQIARFIVNGVRPAEDPALFVDDQPDLLKAASAVRVGIPLLVILALTLLAFSHALWLPAGDSIQGWGTSDPGGCGRD